VSASTRKKILSFLGKSKDKAFIRKEFSSFGSGRQVARVLSELVEEGSLVRAGQSIWVKSVRMPSPFKLNFGEVITIAETDAISVGLQALQKLGYEMGHSKLRTALLEKNLRKFPLK